MDQPLPQTVAPMPEFSDILSNIAGQLLERKKLIPRRVLFVMWPFILFLGLILVLLIPLLPSALSGAPVPGYYHWISAIFFAPVSMAVVAMLFTIIWTLIAGSLTGIETNIWTVSFFDKKPLTSFQSWSTAKKLLWPVFRLNAILFVRYWLLPIIVLVVVFYGAWSMTNLDKAFVVVGGGLGAIILLIIYGYLLTIKFRYLRFIFIKNYNQSGYSPRQTIKESIELNKKLRATDIKEILKIQFGMDALEGVIGGISSQLLQLISRLGGRIVSGELNWYAADLEQYIKQYALTIAYYMVFQKVYSNLYGQLPATSPEIYSLAGV